MKLKLKPMSIWWFWEHGDTVDPIIIVSQTAGAKKKKQVICVPSQPQTTCCAAGLFRVARPPTWWSKLFQLLGCTASMAHGMRAK